MSVKSGFFNSINGDRKYNADDLNSIFTDIFSEGVFKGSGNEFAVSPVSGSLAVQVDTGKAFYNNTWISNDAIYQVTLPTAPQYLSRIDAIILDFNGSSSVRENSITYVAGEVGTEEKPTLINSGSHKQIPLAYVTIYPGASTIDTSNIEYVVGTDECQYVIFETAVLNARDSLGLGRYQKIIGGFDPEQKALQYIGIDPGSDPESPSFVYDSRTIGDVYRPIYFSSGQPAPLTASIGDYNNPVFMSNGSFLPCNTRYANITTGKSVGNNLLAYNGNLYCGVGNATVELYGNDWGKVTFSARYNSSIQENTFTHGLSTYILWFLGTRLPKNAKPLNGGWWVSYDASTGNIDKDIMGYGTCFVPKEYSTYTTYWTPARIYTSIGSIGELPTDAFENHYIYGVAYFTY